MNRILLAIPALDFLPTKCAASHTALVHHYSFDRQLKRERYIQQFVIIGSNYPHARRACVNRAREIGASHLFFLDSDIIVPRDALNRLLAHRVDFVCASYIRRYGDPRTVGVALADGPPHPTLMPMSHAPLGCALIAMSVFDRVPPPWFTFQMETEPQNDRSEDVNFCHKLSVAGVHLWLDPTLTKELGHVTTMPVYYGDIPPP